MGRSPSTNRKSWAAALGLTLALAACAAGDKSKPSSSADAEASGKASQLPYDGVLAVAAMQGRDYEQAIRLWTSVLAAPDLSANLRVRALAGRGGCYAEEHETGPAMADIDAALALKPDSPEIRVLQGEIYLGKRQYQPALDDFETAIRIRPGFAEALAARGDAHRRLRQFDLAIADYDSAIAIKPYSAAFYVGRGRVYLSEGKSDLAMPDLNEAIRRDPKDAAAYKARGIAFFGTDAFVAAATDFSKTLSLRPDQPYVAVLLHLARLRSKSPDQAEFAGNIAKLDLSKWPAPIVEFYQGKLKPDELRTDAAKGPADEVKPRSCEAEFYIAQDLLIAHKTDDARRGLLTARQTCPDDLTEYQIARMELGEA